MWSTKLEELFHDFLGKPSDSHSVVMNTTTENKMKGNLTRKDFIWLTLSGYSSSLGEVWAVVQAGSEAETTDKCHSQAPAPSTHICLGIVLPTVVSFLLHQLPMKTTL